MYMDVAIDDSHFWACCIASNKPAISKEDYLAWFADLVIADSNKNGRKSKRNKKKYQGEVNYQEDDGKSMDHNENQDSAAVPGF